MSTLQTDRHTDRQTDGRTDGRPTIAIPRCALHASRGKKQYYGWLKDHLWWSDRVLCTDDGNIANLNKQLRSSKLDVYYHFPPEVGVATSTVSPETSSLKTVYNVKPLVSLVNEQLFADTQDLNQSLHISLHQRDIGYNSDDLADVVESDTDAGLNDNVDQNELTA